VVRVSPDPTQIGSRNITPLTITTQAAGTGSSGIVVTDTPATYHDGLYTCSRLQAPGTLLNATAGAVAIRIRYGFSSASPPGGSGGVERAAEWANDSSNQLGLQFLNSTLTWRTFRNAAGAGSPAVSAAQTFSAGDSVTVFSQWDASFVYVRVGAAAFVKTANTSIPTLTATTIDLGSTVGTTNELQCAIVWAATFLGTLTDADAATIAAWTYPPPYEYFPAASLVSAIYPMGYGSLSNRPTDAIPQLAQAPVLRG
jgi:hypothetical protein